MSDPCRSRWLRHLPTLAFAAAITVVVAACGGGDDGADAREDFCHRLRQFDRPGGRHHAFRGLEKQGIVEEPPEPAEAVADRRRGEVEALGGVAEAEVVSAAIPQLDGFTAYPTTVFLGRDGRVRRIHAGFYGPATGPAHAATVAEFRREVERLLAEPAP